MRNWIAGQPFTAFSLAALFGSLATAMGLREDWIPVLLGLFIVGLVVMIVSMWKYTAPIVLAVVLALPALDTHAQAPFPEREAQIEPAALPIAAGVVIICVGGYCIYKLSKFCQKHFPPSDKSTNGFFGVIVGGGDEYGGAYNYGALGSCYEPPPSDFAPASQDDATTFRLNVLLETVYSTRITMTATPNDGTTQTFLQFQQEMLTHGLWVSGQPDGSQSFSRNGVPIDPTMSPITFDPVTKSVRNTLVGEGEMRKITVLRSNDMKHWTEFLTTEVGAGAGIQVVDCTREGQMFYRVEMTLP
jgi:hypothetical protein